MRKSIEDIPLRMDVIDAKIFNIRGETFVKPEVVPPVHSHEISKPLVGQLMCCSNENPLKPN